MAEQQPPATPADLIDPAEPFDAGQWALHGLLAVYYTDGVRAVSRKEEHCSRAVAHRQCHPPVVKDEAVKPSPNPLEYRDVGSDTTNDQVGWADGVKAASAAAGQHRPALRQPAQV